jgi:tetratricopeptide (TPR) repeat protein
VRSGSLATALPIGRFVAALAAFVIAVPPTHAAPAPAPEGADAAPATFEEAEALYEQGRAKFETADYTAAIELWTEAYRLVPDVQEGSRIKALLIYNIATAREHAFDVTQDPSQLRQAKILLESFEESIPDLYPDEEQAAETQKVRERIAAIDARLQTAEPEPEPEPEPGPEPIDVPSGPANPGRPLVIAGAVLVGVGVAGLAVMGAGLGIGAGANDLSELEDDDITGRRDQFSRGRSANAMAIGGGVAGGVLAITGAVLLGLGIAKNRRATPTAWLAPGSAGLQLSGRF